MKSIVYVKGSELTDVRLQKFLRFFIENGDRMTFWGWSRDGKKAEMEGVDTHYLLTGGGFGKRSKLFFYYILWTIVVFLKCLRSNLKDKVIIAIDFDSALPVYLASKFKHIDYLYEVYDDFALRYNFPASIKRFVHKKDTQIMRKSKCVIHVDGNRVNFKDCKWIVIENTPTDFFEGKTRDYNEIDNTFAVIGYFSRQRGVTSILEFAKQNPKVKFLVVGRFIEKEDKEAYMSLPNVECHDFMLQNELYKKMGRCCAIFSLYDPNVEINRLAASNKVYDAMMFGIPVITNKEVINSGFIKEHNIGFVIDYDYNGSWDCLKSESFIDKVKEMGTNGRNLYLEHYQFTELVKQRLLPVLLSL